MGIKGLVKRAFSAAGLDVRRKPRASITSPPRVSVPFNVLPLVVEDWIRRRDNSSSFTFVQIGAHDGLHYDPVRGFVQKYHWRGVLVEPQLAIYKRLIENYRNEPQLIFENAAIAEQDGTATLYAFDDPSLPDHATMLCSFNRKFLEHNGHGYAGKIVELKDRKSVV